MPAWSSYLNSDPTEWLLEEDNPSVEYFTLIDILEKSENESEITKAKSQIMDRGTVPKILEKQNKDGSWEDPKKFYTAKYKGTVWQLIILAELAADGNDSRIKQACEFILENSQDKESSGFSMHTSVKKGGGRHSVVIPCLTGNMVWSLIRFGYLEDKRVQRGIEYITKYQRFDDGESKIPSGWPYDRFKACFSKHSCHMGVVKALKALAEIPIEKRSTEAKSTVKEGVEYLLKHHVYKKSHDLSKASKPGWLRFGFPLMYQTDVLEILGILTRLGIKDERMQDAMDKVLSGQDSEGKWLMKNTFNRRFQVNIEQKNKPSKWITLNALRVIKRYYC